MMKAATTGDMRFNLQESSCALAYVVVFIL